MKGKEFVKALDGAVKKESSGEAPRTHIGASEIGSRCARQAWYSFRWHHKVQHTGRIYRLFDRGNEEEFRFVRWLRMMDVEVRDYAQRLMWDSKRDVYARLEWEDDPDRHGWIDVSKDRAHIERATDRQAAPRQWGFRGEGILSHFAGSSDSLIRGVDRWFPAATGWGGAEYKTHNEKSFRQLETKGVVSSKQIHYVQMQQYMHQLKLPWCLYMAVNKNTDHIYVEMIYYKKEVGKYYEDRAKSIIEARTPPARITNDPSWFECKWCDFRDVCHYDKEPNLNCRSCAYASAEADKKWHCNYYDSDIPEKHINMGCDYWTRISG